MKHLKTSIFVIATAALAMNASAHCGSCGSGEPITSEVAHNHANYSEKNSKETLGAYLSLQTALAADDLAASQKAAAALEASLTDGPLKSAAQTLKGASDLKQAREAFHAISNILIPVFEHSDSETPLYLAHCPMAFGNTGADWIQVDEKLANPYFGSMMLRCGTIKPLK